LLNTRKGGNVVPVEQRNAVEREVKIGASPETVFAYFVDSDKMSRWFGTSAELDARPGGIYRVKINDQIIARGEFVEVEPNRRVVFTFGWEAEENSESHAGVPPGSSRVEVALEPDGDGTLVRFRHLDLPEDAREIHGHGWDLYLSRLAVAAAGGDPGPDPNATATPRL
jgi:uncharacterized protein YndB with AHSA1/START domain